jgi:hypothetical protein
MTHELAISIATRAGDGRPNRDVVGLHGWVLYAQQNLLSLTLPVHSQCPTRVALAAGRGAGDGRRDARIAAEWLSWPDGEPSMSARRALDAFRDADEEIRRRRVPGRAGGCAAALLTVGLDGHAVVGAAGGVHVFRMIEGYAGQVTRGDGPGGLGGAEQGTPDPPYEFRAFPGDRLIMCTRDLSDADLIGSGGRTGAQLAYHLAYGQGESAGGEGGDGPGDLTAVVIDVARYLPDSRSARGASQPAPADRPALNGPRPAQAAARTEPERVPDVVR